MTDKNAMPREMNTIVDPAGLEVLYWVGCAAAADERIANIAKCMVRIMNRAGVHFAVLGPEERCTGDPARRTGNDLIFDTLVRANIATLAQYGIRRVVTHCPHCFNTLRNEYPEFGGVYRVQHHTEFLQELLSSERITLKAGVRELVTFHDPCYLARHNGVTEAPRAVLHQIGVANVEMRRSRARGFCCGAGGGHAFFEEHTGGRINRNRASEAVETGADTICTACPFCLSMMEDGVRDADPVGRVRVRDVAELLDEALARDEVDDEALHLGGPLVEGL